MKTIVKAQLAPPQACPNKCTRFDPILPPIP